MRQLARRRTPVAAGCLLAAAALALLSLVTGARTGHLGVPPALRAAATHASTVLRAADPTRPDAAAVVAPLDRGAGVPHAVGPAALVLAAALGILLARTRPAHRSGRPDRGAPTGRGPPAQPAA